jgi:hypothetical protein
MTVGWLLGAGGLLIQSTACVPPHRCHFMKLVNSDL